MVAKKSSKKRKSTGLKIRTIPAISSQTTPPQKRRRGPGRPFVKGDPRIYHERGPKHFNALRKLALEIANDVVKKDNGKAVVLNGHQVEVVEAILRAWAGSHDYQKQNKFIEIGYGKVPDELIITTQDWEKIIDLLPIEFTERIANGEPVIEVLVAFLQSQKIRQEQGQLPSPSPA